MPIREEDISDIRVSQARSEERIASLVERQTDVIAQLLEIKRSIAIASDATLKKADLADLERRVGDLEALKRWIIRSSVGAVTAILAGLYVIGKKLGIAQ